MSNASPPKADGPSRPGFVDFFFLLTGCAISLWFAELVHVNVAYNTAITSPLRLAMLKILPAALFLPVGIQLFWPLYFTTQQISGRRSSFTIAEWVLGVAWLFVLFLVGWAIWQSLGNIPEWLSSAGCRKNLLMVYMLLQLTFGTIAVILGFIDVALRRSQPWTHTLALGLFLWPALPIAIMWLGSITLD